MIGPVKRYGVVTLFPEMFDAIADFGVTRRALDRQVWALDCINPRDFAKDAHRTVDDRPFGGGPGMVMMAEPLDAAIDRALALQRAGGVDRPKVVLFTPQARPLTDRLVRDLAAEAGLVMLCGRYEGIDERLVEARVDVSVSIGDFVLSGGELAAMVLIDAMVRLQPGVLNDGASAAEDSYAPGRDGLLDHPHYTRPEVWQGLAVPGVLTSGDHALIAAWRRKETLRRTLQRRPELMDSREWSKADLQFLAEIRAEAGRGGQR